MTLIYISPAIYAAVRVADIVRPTALVVYTVISLIRRHVIGYVRLRNSARRVGGV